MKKLLMISLFCTQFVMPVEQQSLEIAVDATNSSRVSTILVALGAVDTQLEDVLQVIKKDLLFTDQFDVITAHQAAIHTKKEMKELEDAGYKIAVFIEKEAKKHAYTIHIYDVHKIVMIKGERLEKQDGTVRMWGHTLANIVIAQLLNSQGLFLSKLAYYKTAGHLHTLCVADFDGSSVKNIYQTKRTLAGLRWNLDLEDPLLFYSEWAQLNVPLMSITMGGKKSVAVGFDGLNMLPVFSADRREIIMCLSRNASSQLYSYGYNKKQGKYGYTCLTFNEGSNICPTLLENGDIVFCSDFEDGMPSLYYMDRKNDVIRRLTRGGGAFDPCYSPITKKVIFAQMCSGVCQLMTYDVKTEKIKQLTFDAGDKQECTWSPCGNYVAFTYSEQKKHKKRIAIQNVSIGIDSRKYITAQDVSCSYPAWSPNYADFPVVM